MLDTIIRDKKLFRLIAKFSHPQADLELLMGNDRLDALGYDSLARVELAMEIEDEFDIALPDDMMLSVETVGGVLKLVAGQLQ